MYVLLFGLRDIYISDNGPCITKGAKLQFLLSNAPNPITSAKSFQGVFRIFMDFGETDGGVFSRPIHQRNFSARMAFHPGSDLGNEETTHTVRGKEIKCQWGTENLRYKHNHQRLASYLNLPYCCAAIPPTA